METADAPVLDWHWLASVERCDTSSWRPRHLLLQRGAELVAACPVYVRDDAAGEFVWSGQIEQAMDEVGMPFGPRAVVGIPATPIPGRRFLTGPGIERALGVRLLARALGELLAHEGLASINVHFCAVDEVAILAAEGWIERRQWQYEWARDGRETFDQVLGAMSSRRRRTIRRERRDLAAAGVQVEMVQGAQAPASLFEEAGRLYEATAARYGGAPGPIDARFFTEIGASPLAARVLFGVASLDGDLAGLALHVVGDGVLYGRTWGARIELPFLHFEVAYYSGIDWCLAHGIDRFHPGHGGDYKRSRGFEPVRVSSLHRFADARLHGAVGAWAAHEREFVEERLGTLGSAYRTQTE